MSEDNRKQATSKDTEVSKVPNEKKYFSFDMGFFDLRPNFGGFDEMKFGMFKKDIYVKMSKEEKEKITEGLWLIRGEEKGVRVRKQNIERDLIGEHGASIGPVHDTRDFKSLNLRVCFGCTWANDEILQFVWET